MKRILALILSAVLVLGVVTVSASESEASILGLLAELEIMSGDPDGNLRLDDYVSRAEFTKLAVAASSYKNSVATNLAISPFPDVTYKHWAAPYVRVGVTGGIVSGYPDGTFKPEDTVLYEEAITMLLRVLGYTDSDFGVSWPAGQIGLAGNLDMTDDVDCSAGEIMNRRQVAQLVYNTLKTKQKGTQNNLLTLFDAALYTDITLVAGSGEDSAIASDEIFTSNGTFKIESGFDKSYIGSKGDAIVKDGTKLIAFIPDAAERTEQEYIVYSVLGSKVMAYQNGSVRQIDINDDTAAYKGTTKTTFEQLKSQLELGDRLVLRKSDTGEIDYITYAKGDVAGPVTAISGTWRTTLNVPSDVTITRNGTAVTEADIQNYDVVYYLKDLNMVMAYSTRVNGIYEKATPNRDMPTAITVSGKEYEIEGSAAFNKLYSGGSFVYGDTVTLLLGKDNRVADVIGPNESYDDVVGYIIGTGTKEYASGDVDTFTNYYIKVVQADGQEYEFVTDRDYSESINSVSEISFESGYARVKTLRGSTNISGTFDWDKKRLGTQKLSAEIEILDITTTMSSKSGQYTTVFGQRLDDVEIKSDSVLYMKKNDLDEIEKLILNDVTGDAYSYGVLTGANLGKDSGKYEYISDGNRYSASGSYSASRNTAVKIIGSLQNPTSMVSINEIKDSISSLSVQKLVAGGTTHIISDDVNVYTRPSQTSTEYSMTSLEDVMKNKNRYKITAFYDKTKKAGGRVRVIIATEK